MDNTIQVNNIKRAIGQLTFRVSIMQLRDAISDFTDSQAGIEKIQNAVKDLGVSVTPLDDKYYFTSWDNWQKIIAVINPIVQQFEWVSERFDCDNRANLVCSLISLIFEINTCAGLYCDVFDAKTGDYKYRHYANLIVDKDDNVWLWDVDNGGQYTKITSNNPILGSLKYNLMSIRCY